MLITIITIEIDCARNLSLWVDNEIKLRMIQVFILVGEKRGEIWINKNI